jgi:hypothetical protein
MLERGTFVATLPARPPPQAGVLSPKSGKPTQRVVIGVVPDGTRAVLVHTPKSAIASSTVSQNVFTLRDRTPDPPEVVTLIR